MIVCFFSYICIDYRDLSDNMKKILGLKFVANISLFIILISGLVYTFGFGSSLYMARQEVARESGEKINLAISNIKEYVDGQLKGVEDVAYTLIGSKFGNTHRDAEGNSFVTIDPKTFKMPSEEEMFSVIENFLNSNPQICGAAIGFEDSVIPYSQGEFGTACYVTTVSGKPVRLRLGEVHDFRAKEWYHDALTQDKPRWSRPFRETSMGKVVACYSIPLHGYGNRKIGVLALDIDTDEFRQKCTEIIPFEGSKVAILDHEFHFIAHPDTSFILRNLDEMYDIANYDCDESLLVNLQGHKSGQYTVNKGTARAALFSFEPIPRTAWTITVECPEKELYGNIEKMKRNTTWIACISILVMIVSLIWLFRNLQKVTISKAGIEHDLKIASAIQMGMIPKLYPAFPNRKELDVCGFLKPAKSVGGDLYDYFIREEKFFFCIGDVSGKGIPASLFMAVVRSLFRNVSLHEDNPAAIADALNTGLAEGNEYNMFCTMFIGVLDLQNGHLDYCNCGHNPPIARRIKEDGSMDVHYITPKTNLAIGMFEGFPFEREETEMKPGEAFFLYTDGVTEAENIDKKLFGEENTLKSLAKARAHNVRTAQDFVLAVYDDVAQYSQGAEQSDDITMLVVEYKGKSSNG